MKLTTYFRSTAAYRVRIALNLKGIKHELVPINLLTGEHKHESFRQHNPDALLPTLETNGAVLTQSLAILEYIEDIHPQPTILSQEPIHRAYIRSLAQSVACDIHPLNNLRVCQYLVEQIGVDEETKMQWYFHWLQQGFDNLETRLRQSPHTGEYCFGDSPSLADICLVPQVYNANRFNFDLGPYPIIDRINARCLGIKAFADASPSHQADAP